MPSLIYVADPMCSWCYAFEPEIDRIVERCGLPVRVVLGGLFVGSGIVPLDDGLRSYLRETWERVEQLSGQPISRALLDRSSWTYDTELACRAVVGARQIDEARALPMLHRLHDAFYRQSVDLTDPDVYGPLADDAGVDGSALRARLDQLDLIAATRADFAETTTLGVQGFPTLLLDNGDERITVSIGYGRADRILRSIEVLAG